MKNAHARVPSVIAATVAVALDNPHLSFDRTYDISLNPVNADGSPMEVNGPVYDASGLELNFNGACPYRHVARITNNNGTFSYVPVLYCPVDHPDRDDIETAKEMNDSSTTSNLFVRGGKFADPRDAAWVAEQIAEEPLVSWLEYFDLRIWSSPTPPTWKGEPVADDATLEDFVANIVQGVRIHLTVEPI